MGYTTYAVGVVGLRFAPGGIVSKLYTKEEVRGCNHVMRDNAKFCPECGAKAFKTERKSITEYNEDAGNPLLCGYALVSRSEEDLGDPEFIAYDWSGYDDVRAGDEVTFSMDTLERLPTIKAEMQKLLQPLGLWDERAFGVHVFLYESW